MKVLCISDRNSIGGKIQSYTAGRWYDVTNTANVSHMFYIISDNGTNPAVEKKNFVTLEEYRENKLKQIGI